MEILATYNIKGGVGKTAAAVNLAYLAAREGRRTLLWDLDPQGAASFYFRIKPRVKGGGQRLLRRRKGLDAVVKGTDFELLDLLPADFSYRNLDVALADAKKPKGQLLKLVRPLADVYDLVVLDCPPSISLVSENVFRAADALVIPLIPTVLSLHTYHQLLGHLGRDHPERITLLPFFSMVDRRKTLHLETMRSLRTQDPRVLAATIPYASVVERMGVRRAPLASFAPLSPAAVAYEHLWAEMRALLRGRPGPGDAEVQIAGPAPKT